MQIFFFIKNSLNVKKLSSFISVSHWGQFLKEFELGMLLGGAVIFISLVVGYHTN